MKKTTLSLLFILLTLQGCAAVVVGGAAAGGYLIGKDERSASVIASDSWITTNITSKYTANKHVNVFTIDVDTYEGVVTLNGKVKDQEAKVKAIDIARKTKGVQKVVSKLVIEASAPVEEVVN